MSGAAGAARRHSMVEKGSIVAERRRDPRLARGGASPASEEQLELRAPAPPREALPLDSARARRSAEAAPRRRAPGAELAAQLRGRGGLRRAVLLQEILSPPLALRSGREAP